MFSYNHSVGCMTFGHTIEYLTVLKITETSRIYEREGWNILCLVTSSEMKFKWESDMSIAERFFFPALLLYCAIALLRYCLIACHITAVHYCIISVMHQCCTSSLVYCNTACLHTCFTGKKENYCLQFFFV